MSTPWKTCSYTLPFKDFHLTPCAFTVLVFSINSASNGFSPLLSLPNSLVILRTLFKYSWEDGYLLSLTHKATFYPPPLWHILHACFCVSSLVEINPQGWGPCCSVWNIGMINEIKGVTLIQTWLQECWLRQWPFEQEWWWSQWEIAGSAHRSYGLWREEYKLTLTPNHRPYSWVDGTISCCIED